jgi:hypothetical protein
VRNEGAPAGERRGQPRQGEGRARSATSTGCGALASVGGLPVRLGLGVESLAFFSSQLRGDERVHGVSLSDVRLDGRFEFVHVLEDEPFGETVDAATDLDAEIVDA